MTLRIALISEHASPAAALGGVDCGGQNVYVAELAARLGRRGHVVDVFTRRDRADQREVLDWAPGVRIVNVPAGPATTVRKEDLLPFMPEFSEWLVDFAVDEGIAYDVAHANFWMSGLAALTLRQRLGVPFVITFHALGRVRRQYQRDADGFPDERMDIEDRLVADADGIVAECPEDATNLVRLYDADEGRLRLIPCGVSGERFRPVAKARARAALGLSQTEPVLLQLGRLVPRKGVDDAIRATAIVRQQHGIPARLLVVGGESEDPDPAATPELVRLRAIAEELGIAGAVTFVGRRCGDVLRFYYSAADVFVTLPWYEPFGMTPLEAMACGTPVVGSSVGGIRYSVRDGETGYLVSPHSPAEAAGRIARLCRTPWLRESFGQAALRDVHARFSWEDVTDAMVGFYQSVLPDARRLPTGARAWPAVPGRSSVGISTHSPDAS